MGRGFNRGGRGGGGRGRGRGGGGGGGRGGNRDNGGWRDGGRTSAQSQERSNKEFEQYYNEMGILEDEEKEAFWKAMKVDLPNSFRFAGSKGHALTVQKRLVDFYIPEITSVKFDGQNVEPPRPIKWFPNQLAWEMTTPKHVIRKFKPFASFQKFLVSENDVGNITRQEIVSMVPPLFMDIKPGMTVLDLCAAPGSKSAQLIEMLHGGEEARVRRVIKKIRDEIGEPMSPGGMETEAEEDQADNEDDYADDGRSTGLLIANDKEWRRAQMLVHQTKRLNSPNIVVTNHDATIFPSIKAPGSSRTYLKFDRILADVPCSGDGTVRKNPGIWRDWTPGNGLGLHSTQVKILVRALQMLKAGGRCVFSTCSLNPIENESVVAEAVRRCGGSERVKILPTSEALPGLQRRAGLRSWPVKDKSGRAWDSFQEVEDAREKGEELNNKIQRSMFPPLPEEEIPLDRCIRIYPHLQDTGGFFVSVLEKQKEFTTKQPNGAKATENNEGAGLQAMVNDIDQATATGSAVPGTLPSADEVAGPIPETRPDSGGAPPVALQPREVLPGSPRKRAADEALGTPQELDATAKRTKLEATEANVDDVPGETRAEHWPPPPGAELETSNAENAEEAKETVAAQNGTKPSSEPTKTSVPPKKPGQPVEEAFKFLDPDHPELTSIYSFYDISPRFPRDRFMVRNVTGEPVKAIYYCASLCRDILRENEGKGIKFVHSGVKMFVKQDVQGRPDACKWRIQTEGLPVIEPWVGARRTIHLHDPALLHKLLKEMFPRIEDDAWASLGAVSAQCKEKAVGCLVLRAQPSLLPSGDRDPAGFAERLVMPLWRGLGSVNLMLPKDERKAMLLRLFNDAGDLVDHSQHMKNAPQAQGKTKPDARAAEARRETKADDAVPTRGNTSSPEPDAAMPAPREIEAQAAADTHEANKLEAQENDREVYPGVGDEDGAFNKTV